MSPAPAEKPHRHIEPASDTEVWDEQYAWLRVHAERCTMAGCEHCLRMKRLKEILMQPFREEKYYAVQIAKRKAIRLKRTEEGAGK